MSKKDEKKTEIKKENTVVFCNMNVPLLSNGVQSYVMLDTIRTGPDLPPTHPQ